MRDSTNVQAPVEKKAIIAMSGGVDSSVAALLCQQQGFDCVGVTLALTDNSDRGLPEEAFPGERTCCSVDDVADARSVAFRLGMPFYVFNFKEAFRREVMDRFAAAYQRGETPNPCIDCNRYIKFAKLMHRGEEIGFPYVATGHYARVEQDGATGRWLLKKGLDENKDQSYMLYRLPQEVLSRLILPLGNFEKDDVREIARDIELACADAPDSMEICFIPDGEYAAFIRVRGFTPKNGRFIGPDGEDLGPHAGVDHYTVGQRKGLGIAAGRPLFVKAILPDGNIQLAESGGEYASRMTVADIATPDGAPLADGDYQVKVRSAAKAVPCQVCGNPDGTLTVIFPEPVRAPAPGQSAVFYRGGFVFGGGFIHSAE